MISLEEALALCKEAHKGQFRNDGITPYHEHPIQVAELVNTEEDKIAALLHDVIEDTSYTLQKSPYGYRKWIEAPDGTEYLISENVYWTLHFLTHNRNVSYAQYITAMIESDNPENKLIIKIADISCNLLDSPNEKQRMRYRAALAVLIPALAKIARGK